MNNYIGFKMVQAEPMMKDGKVGYKVIYPDGYESWSPKEVFEKAYMKVIGNGDLKSDISISQQMVDDFIKSAEVLTIGNKTTVVNATLINGFNIVKSSSCVDPANYSEKVGSEICMEQIKDEVWKYLGFLLQTAVNGIK